MESLSYKALIILILSFSINWYAYAALDINTATQTELEGIKGFGPVKAKAIIDYRKAHGRFKSIEALDNVNGIGPGTIEKVRKALSVSASERNETSTQSSEHKAIKKLSTTSGVIDEFTHPPLKH
jgi:competence protein ComEA